MAYSKHKDRTPQDTIFAIQEILNKAGLHPVMKWHDSKYEGVRSNRVCLYPSRLGTNGKGTDDLYAAASGYAELMERLQNSLLSIHSGYFPMLGEKHQCYIAPDEEWKTVDEILMEKNYIHDYIYEKLGLRNYFEKEEFLSHCAKMCFCQKENRLPVIPFVDVESGKILKVIPPLIWLIYASNGMAAGNTIEEAMVQALSEIFERYVNSQIINGKAVPPRIPDENLKDYGFWPLIEEMKKDTGYEIGLYDCSLGKGVPVVGCIVVNRKTGTFGMKLGSHPSFAVAAERTLTEAMQGRAKLEDFASICWPGSQKEASGYHNFSNVAKVGVGAYPVSLFTKEPDWDFVPWPEDTVSNQEFLQRMFVLLKELGFRAWVRDVSFLGFPSCYILVPGMSEIFQASPMHCRSVHTQFSINAFAGRFPKLSWQEEEMLLTLIRFKENSALENRSNAIFMRPLLGNRMSSSNIGAFIAYKHGRQELALHFFQQVYLREKDEEEKTAVLARIAYIKALVSGCSHEEAARLLRRLFTAQAADRVISELQEPDKVMERVFPQLKCFDCEHCELRYKECDAHEIEVMDKVFAALGNGKKISQEALLEKLKAMGI